MISIIIPTYNEEKNIRDFIYDLYCLYDIKKHEVIFIDGGSSDKTLDILKELSYFGYHYEVSTKKGRANQMNYGASLASGDTLWFVHADSTINKDALLKIDFYNYDIGCLKIRFHPSNFAIYFNSLMSTQRVLQDNIAFGDQGIFVKREIFEKIGGYKDMPIMEDYRFSEDITKLGYKFKVLDCYITTSSRRYKGKTLRTMYQMQTLQKWYRQGVPIEEINKRYKDVR